MSRRRVVITGNGTITPVGASAQSSFNNMLGGKSGIRAFPQWLEKCSDLQGILGAPVTDVDLMKHYPRKQRRTMGRVALLARHATDEAIAQSGLTQETLSAGRCGVAYGSTSGSSAELEAYSLPLVETRSMKGMRGFSYLRIMAHTCAANLASTLGIKGRVESTCTACTSASQAIGRGYELIRSGVQDVMLCGGAEELHYTTVVTFDLLMAISTRYNASPDESPRPFDSKRDGLVVGEGAGTLILESYEHAKARGATILGELVGYASNCDGAEMTSPDAAGMQRVMESALADAEVTPRDIGYINAHATATQVGDIAESNATYKTFGDNIAVSSTKGAVGHTLGACGAIEASWTLSMLNRGVLAPTRNLTDVDPKCAPLDYVQSARETTATLAMNNNFAFGGINTSMVLRAANAV